MDDRYVYYTKRDNLISKRKMSNLNKFNKMALKIILTEEMAGQSDNIELFELSFHLL